MLMICCNMTRLPRPDPLVELLLSRDETSPVHKLQKPNKIYIFVMSLFFTFTIILTIYFLCISTSRSPTFNNFQTVVKKNNSVFIRPSGTEHLQCSWLFDNKHSDYTKSLGQKRSKYVDPDNFEDLPMDCGAITRRHRWPTVAGSAEEAGYGIAHARAVFKDYFYLELMLAATYQPQNWYCYAVDKKADHLFRARIIRLAKCFPNVVVTHSYRKMDSAGHFMDQAHVDCMKLLAKSEMHWEYIHLLQNHDVPIKTNYESVQIMKWLNGSNDIEVSHDPGRIDKYLNWTMEAVHIFKNKSRLDALTQKFNSTPMVTFAKGYNEITISRKAVDYIFAEIDLQKIETMMDRQSTYGVDELMFPTLLTLDQLNIPGSFTQECLNRNTDTPYITRASNWSGGKCNSKIWRHAICIFGVEDLEPIVDKFPHFFANKIMPDTDYNALTCWMEKLFNRTFLEPPTKSRLNETFYKSLAHVRYQKIKDRDGIVTRDSLIEFKCKL